MEARPSQGKERKGKTDKNFFMKTTTISGSRFQKEKKKIKKVKKAD